MSVGCVDGVGVQAAAALADAERAVKERKLAKEKKVLRDAQLKKEEDALAARQAAIAAKKVSCSH